ncbi:MAG TPA: hypothetical protein ACFYEK_16320 [Candidatus Wunengus sp. YC60]|uniref:hypothetical protein n=1 Tax=Candidatus Wunengus sp. YC60 TaxID=3367697 RepID=UPI0040290F62
MKTVLGTLSIVFLLIAVVSSIAIGLTSWHIDQDINGWKSRAQVSSEPHDMLLYMSNVKAGMEKWGITSGNAALFFPTPETDIAMILRSIQQHIDQAKILTAMDRSTPQYQTGLDNLRGSIRELNVHAFQDWSNHDGLLLTITVWLGWILFIVFALWWFAIY